VEQPLPDKVSWPECDGVDADGCIAFDGVPVHCGRAMNASVEAPYVEDDRDSILVNRAADRILSEVDNPRLF
jgi:hypothetical protein